MEADTQDMVSQLDDRVATLTLNRPDRLSPLSDAMIDGLRRPRQAAGCSGATATCNGGATRWFRRRPILPGVRRRYGESGLSPGKPESPFAPIAV
jgi:hypothetical protein